MNPAEIARRTTEEGLLLAPSPSGNISAKGEQSTIDKWLPTIRQSKAANIDKLRFESQSDPVVTLLRENPRINFAIKLIDANTDPVAATIGIRNVAIFEMGIP